MTRKLMLLRHAKSDWNAPHETDFERPLNARGRHAAAVMAQFIAALQQPPQWIVTSTAARALATAERIAEELDEVALLEDASLYGAGVSEVLAAIRKLPADVDSALLVGHNPTMDWLVGELSGDPTLEMKTASLAVFSLNGEWQDVSRETCQFELLQHPRELSGELSEH